MRSGKLRALAVTTAKRSAALPEVPPLAESVPGYEASAVTGIGVPKGTPAEIVETLNKAVQAAFADAAMKAKLADTGGAPLPGIAGGVRQADGGRDREMGQGGQGGRHQGGVSRSVARTPRVIAGAMARAIPKHWTHARHSGCRRCAPDDGRRAREPTRAPCAAGR